MILNQYRELYFDKIHNFRKNTNKYKSKKSYLENTFGLLNIYIHNIGDIETIINDKNLYYQIVDPSNQIKRRIEINNINIIEVKTALLAKLKNVTI